MSRKQEIDKYIQNFPYSLEVDFRNLLKQLRDGEISKEKIQMIMHDKVGIACNVVKHRREKCIKKENRKLHSKLICGND